MPIYTYRCENCGVQFERRQKFSDEPLSVCPECEKESLRKVYLPVGIVFKGSGFYSTDNRSSSKVLPPKSEDGDSSTKKDKPDKGKKEKSKSKEKS
jgi:putative FmdB family regulatory protein